MCPYATMRPVLTVYIIRVLMRESVLSDVFEYLVQKQKEDEAEEHTLGTQSSIS